jgi:NodT family efflux transporter outer membrane factor (OMF) lipoprotein
MRQHFSNRGHFLALSTPAMLILASGGCMVGPNYTPPQAPVQQQWMDPGSPSIQRGTPELTTWWEVFNDPVLNNLVEGARQNNPSLQAAGVRVLQAQAARAIAIGLLFPQQQDAFGNYTWSQTSENAGAPQVLQSRVLNRAGLITNPLNALLTKAYGQPRIDNQFNNWEFGGSVAWELDLWGRYRRGIEAADANVLASVATYDDVLVSLIAEVASNYVLIRTLNEQSVIIRQNIELQQKALGIAQERFKAGTRTVLDPLQSEALVRDTEALLPAITASTTQARNALCVLLGVPPQDLSELLGEEKPIPSPPETVAIGVPAELLRRRPDIRLAEQRLAAQSAQIGIAITDMLPRFSLTGELGLSAERFPDLFQGNSFEVFAGPSFRWAILNYGRLINNVRVQDAGFQALIGDYETTVLRAQSEVENAIAGLVSAQHQIPTLTRSTEVLSQAAEVSDQQYREGTADYVRVLTAQQSLLQAQLRLIFTRASAAQDLITLYRALGGGWQIRECQEMVPESIKAQMRERTKWGHMIDKDRFQIAPAEVLPAATQPAATQPAASGPVVEARETTRSVNGL